MAVDIVAVLYAVNMDDLVVFEDLVDDPIVTATRESETVEFAHQRLAQPFRVLGDGTEDGFERSVPDLLRKSVEMAQSLRRDLNLAHEAASDMVAKLEPLALGCLRAALEGSSPYTSSMSRSVVTTFLAAGWLIGIPVGYAMALVIVWFFGRAVYTSFSLLLPPWLPLVALAGAIVVARLTLRPPLRRTVRLGPGDALRYE